MRYQSHSLAVIKDIRPHRGYVIGVGIALFLGLSLSPLLATASTATEAVKSTIDQVASVLEDTGLEKHGGVMERRKQLQKIIGDRFNYEEMAKRSLGAH